MNFIYETAMGRVRKQPPLIRTKYTKEEILQQYARRDKSRDVICDSVPESLRRGEVANSITNTLNLPHADTKGCDGRRDDVGSSSTPLSPFIYSATPCTKETSCTLCLKSIDVGDGDDAHFGLGNSKPFHKTCLKLCLPHIGIISFTPQKEMTVLSLEHEMIEEGEEVTYKMSKIVMDGGKRLRVLECLILNIPLDDDCLHISKKREKREGERRVRVRNEKEVIKI